MNVCHECDNRACVNPNHLFLGSQSDNLLDMKLKDRHARGERNRHAKLTDAEVVEIRNATGPHKGIAERYGVCASSVSLIRSGRTWRHLL